MTISGPPPSFDTYWTNLDVELGRFPARPVLEPNPTRDNAHSTLYNVTLTSIGPYRIFGYLSVPRGDGPFPAVLQTPNYGSVNHVPDYNDRRRYVVLTIMHRGQRLADQPYAAAYPGLLTDGVDDADEYVYRGIAADCLRAAEFLLSRPEVDPERVAITGGDLAVITAARRDGFNTLVTANPLFYRLMEARQRSNAYPVEELNDYLRAHPDHEADVAATLAHFDPRHHATNVTAHTVLSVGDDGSLSGQEFLQPLIAALAGEVEQYPITHRGRIDQDTIDRILAARLGVTPMSKFIREFE